MQDILKIIEEMISKMDDDSPMKKNKPLKLLPCPLCGNSVEWTTETEARTRTKPDDDGQTKITWIYISHPLGAGCGIQYKGELKLSIERWNNRIK